MLKWPDPDRYDKSDCFEIEHYLRTVIRHNEVTLLGEIDLNSQTDYAGIGWSLLDLANHQIDQRVMVNYLNLEPWQWNFPATLAIWSVGHSQSSEEGGKLWDQLEDYSTTQRSKLAQKFTNSMDLLHFDLFENELQVAQKHVQLASIHAMIPDFAIPRYAEIVEHGVRLDRPREQILEEIISDPAISKGVARLFSARRELALDLVERTFNFIAYGYGLGLPQRIISKLSKDAREGRKRVAREAFPEIRFFESERRPIILGDTAWDIRDVNGEMLDQDQFPPVHIYAVKEETSRISLMDPTSGYLVFDDAGKLMSSERLPEHAGFILWNDKTKFISNISDLDPSYLLGWDDWQYSYFQSLDRVELGLRGGETKVLLRVDNFKIDLNTIPYLVDAEHNSVLSGYPIIASGQRAKVTDNLKNVQHKLDGSKYILGEDSTGLIDFTISAGLGKSTRIKALVVPGFSIAGLREALIEGEKREVSLALPEGWIFTYPASLANKSTGKLDIDADIALEVIEILDPKANQHTIHLDIPILSWSLVFNDRENQTNGSEAKMLLENRKHIEALILHEVDEYLPPIKVGETSVIGKQRGRDARFDLRFLQQDNSTLETVVTLPWNYKTLNLVSFRKLEKRKPAVLKSFKDLENPILLEEAGLFTVEDWKNFLSAKQQEHIKYRDRLRNMRGR